MHEQVVLVPGLWMPGVAMGMLSAQLARRGYRTRVFAYRGRSSFEENVERLARFVREELAGDAAHFVGHSLGGVLILATLSRRVELPAASAVLLGSPVRGCRAGQRLARAALGRWMMGGCASLWEARSAQWARPEPLGVVAGTLPLGLGRALGRLPGTNDGVVCVEETEVTGMSAHALVPLGHSALIVSPRVAGLVCRFLAERRFE